MRSASTISRARWQRAVCWNWRKSPGKAEYHAAAVRLVDGLLEHCIDWTQNSCGLLTKCTASYHDDGAGRHTNITYGDYFLVEALAKLTGSDPMLWR